jgi:hypothetical protein
LLLFLSEPRHSRTRQRRGHHTGSNTWPTERTQHIQQQRQRLKTRNMEY